MNLSALHWRIGSQSHGERQLKINICGVDRFAIIPLSLNSTILVKYATTGPKWGPFKQVQRIGHFGKYHNTLCLSPQILHKHCFQFLLGLTMVPRENKNNSYAKFGRTNKEYYSIFRSGLLERLTLYAHVVVKTANVVISRCCFLQRTTRSYSKKRAASAARLFFTIRLIKFLNCDAFTPFAIVTAKMNKNKRFACSSRAFFYFCTFFSRSLQFCIVKWPFLTYYRERGHTLEACIFFPSFDTAPLEPVPV